MKNKQIHTLSFSVNNWEHLYSLQKAIQYNRQAGGNTLHIKGRFVGQSFLQNTDTDVCISFLQSLDSPQYTRLDENLFILGEMTYSKNTLTSDISVDPAVFEELRKNLLEYNDLEGIHIVVSLSITSNNNFWEDGESLNIIQLNYAMKGDA